MAKVAQVKMRAEDAGYQGSAASGRLPGPIASSDPAGGRGGAKATSTPSKVLEAMAASLDAHPDFRVLRRLVPQRDFGRAAAGPVQAVLILDVETTGLDSRTDRIIELAMLRVEVDAGSGRALRVVDAFEGFEDPGAPIDRQITRITGIDDAMVRDRRLDDARVLQVLEGVNLVIAHNARFDRAFVEARFPAFAHLAWACSCTEIDWAAEDRSSTKLSSLAMAYGWFFDGHRALMDCHATLAVVDHPLPVSGGTGLARLLAAAGERSYRVRATAAPFETKDALKARGYRWDSEARVWHTLVGTDRALTAERAWLKKNVYGGKGATIAVEELDATVRFSARAGRRDAVRL